MYNSKYNNFMHEGFIERESKETYENSKYFIKENKPLTMKRLKKMKYII